MVSPNQSHLQQEWNPLKPLIQQLYIVENRTVAEIQNIMRFQGFDATERQYKVKLSQWNFKKKLSWKIYFAMYVVMQSENQQCTFEVPRRLGTERKLYNYEEVAKAYRRVESSQKWRKLREEGSLPIMDLESAYLKLHQHGITVVPDESAQYSHEEKSSSSGIGEKGMEPTGLGLKRSSFREEQNSTHIIYDSDHRNDVVTFTDTSSTASTEEWTIVTKSVPNAQLDEPSSSVRPESFEQPPDGELQDLHASQRPAFNSHRNVDKTLSNTIPCVTDSWGIFEAKHTFHNDQTKSVLSRTTVMQYRDNHPTDEITEMFAHLVVDGQSRRKRIAWGNFVGDAIPKTSYTSEEADALEWAAYYIQQCFAGWNTLDGRNHTDRLAAMKTFRRMLKCGNSFILLYINWVITVLGSHRKPQQLIAFLEDCCVEVDCLPPVQWKPVFDAILHFLHAVQTNCKTEEEVHGPKLRDTRQAVQRRYGQFSSSYLVISYQYAWYLMQQNNPHDALSILLECLPISRDHMGRQHLLTLNCQALLSRAYNLLGEPMNAIQMLKSTLYDPNTVSKPLQAYHYRLAKLLSELHITAGNLQDAQALLIKVMEFRVQSFGRLVDTTWDAIHNLCQVLTMQNRQHDADILYSINYEAYKREIREKWIEQYGSEPIYIDSDTDMSKT